LSSRLGIALSGFVAIIALAGCYGSTEPATDIGPETATLRGQGTANNGPAYAVFQYWIEGNSDDRRVSQPAQNFPAGASGPFSKKVSGLAADSTYAFRVCGGDQGTESVCANTRTFKTQPAVEDSAHGGVGSGCCFGLSVDARSGPSGQDAHGQMHFYSLPAFSPGDEFDGFVTCLEVDGKSATIGAVGQRRQLGTQDPDWHVASMVLTVVDGQLGADSYAHNYGPPECDEASTGPESAGGAWIVNDAAASTPTVR
jgi:hypothetical protein